LHKQITLVSSKVMHYMHTQNTNTLLLGPKHSVEYLRVQN